MLRWYPSRSPVRIIGAWLAVGAVALGAPASALATVGSPAPAIAFGMRCGSDGRVWAVALPPKPHQFELLPSGRVARAGGKVNLIPAWSPFGLAVTPEGSFIYDMDVTVEGLPDPGLLGPHTTYVVWLATPSLDKVKNMGTISNGEELAFTADWNKMMVVISAESATDGSRWSGPIVLSGRTPSARLENFAGHDLFSGGTPLC